MVETINSVFVRILCNLHSVVQVFLYAVKFCLLSNSSLFLIVN